MIMLGSLTHLLGLQYFSVLLLEVGVYASVAVVVFFYLYLSI